MFAILLTLVLVLAPTAEAQMFTPPNRIQGVGIDRLNMSHEELQQATEEQKLASWFWLLRDVKAAAAPALIHQPEIVGLTRAGAVVIQNALQKYGIDPSEIERYDVNDIAEIFRGLIFIESYGNPTARNYCCAGIVQLSRGSARDLGLSIGRGGDERLNPAKAIPAAAERIASRVRTFGRLDLAVAEYHMGSGNLYEVIRHFTGVRVNGRNAASVVLARALTYPRIYFTTTPINHPSTYRFLHGLDDASATYWFRVLAAVDVLRFSRENPAAFFRLVLDTYTNKTDRNKKASSRMWYLYGPRDITAMTIADQAELQEAWNNRIVMAFNNPEWFGFGLRLAGESPIAEAEHDSAIKPLYYGSEKATIGALIYVATETRSLMGEQRFQAFETNSLVRDAAYQTRLIRSNGNAVTELPTHVMAKAFDIPIKTMNQLYLDCLLMILRDLERKGLITFVREGVGQLTLHVLPIPDETVVEFFEGVYDAALGFARAQSIDSN
ncbi:MAG: transglycosylase SLT domain-containing protein [bacterium]|nr:transglycosylase SLT domain-containing protein [bacterium]